MLGSTIETPLDLIHYLVQGENFDVLKPAVKWSRYPARHWSRAIAAALQVYNSQIANTPASIQLQRAEQYVWNAKLQHQANAIHLCIGLRVDVAAVHDAIASVCGKAGKAEVTLYYDGAMNLLIELPKAIDRRVAIGRIIESLKLAGVEAYCE